jgi:hypothetical protein
MDCRQEKANEAQLKSMNRKLVRLDKEKEDLLNQRIDLQTQRSEKIEKNTN